MRRTLSVVIIVLTLSSLLCRESGVYTDKKPGSTGDDPGDSPVAGIKLEKLEVTETVIEPSFSPDIYSYSAGVLSHRSEIKITALPADGCSVKIFDMPLDPLCYCLNMPVDYGVNRIPVYVDYTGVEGIIYTLNIYRMRELSISNPSFELYDSSSHPSSWTMKGAGESIATPDFSHSGICSATFTTLTASISGRELISTPVGITGGMGIILSAWFYLPIVDGALAERVNISFKIYYFTDQEGTLPASPAYHTMQKVSLAEQGVWQSIEYARSGDEIPADAKYACAAIRASYNSGSGGSKNDKIFFDDVSLQQ